MPLDSLTLGALARELDAALAQARVDKIYMPRPGEAVFHLRAESGACRLLVSAAGAAGRAHLTGQRAENPETPPMLCMLLRKHLAGGRILSVTQPEEERMLRFAFSATDEMGERVEKALVCELMGRRTNLILLGGDGTVLACFKKVDAEMSPDRPVLPGLRYRMPPRREMIRFLHADEAALHEAARQALAADEPDRALPGLLEGLSPFLSRELTYRARGDVQRLAGELADLQARAREGRLEPWVVRRGGQPVDFSCMPITHLPDVECEKMPSFSEMLDLCFAEKARRELQKTVASDLQKTVANAVGRLERKLGSQKQELSEAEGREKLKHDADLITANLHAIRSGEKQARVVDYFTEGMPEAVIDLDPDLSPQQNAQRMYKKYARMKNAELKLREQIEKGERELEYLKTVAYSLTQAQSARDVEGVRQELSEAGYLKNRRDKGKKPKPQAFAPRRFDLPDGFEALCGRSNTENDELTMRRAQKNDLWLHVRGAPGSHVIVPLRDGREPTPAVIEGAAAIAARFSSLSAQPRVPVDYTRVRHVKKPQGARPGMVNYFQYQTVLVAPAQL